MNSKLRKTGRLSKRAAILMIMTVFVSTLLFYLYKPQKAHAQIFLTSGTTWTVPTDWSNSNNTIEAIGGGGGGGGGFSDGSGSGGEGGGGGGSGAYAKAVNVSLSPGSTVTVAIGSGGSAGATGASGVKGTAGGTGGDTYLCNSTSNCSSITGSSVVVGAKGGGGGDAGFTATVGAAGAAGSAASSVGSTTRSGGAGGTGGTTSSGAGGGGGGGAGAAGPNAVGNNGSNGSGINGGNGGVGDGTAGGSAGSGATTGGANGGAGGNGTEYDSTHGAGGGAGGGAGISRGSGGNGGTAGAYGAGGAGGGGNGSKQGSGGAGSTGNQGMIRINYTFTTQNDYRWRYDDGNETTGSSLAAQDTAATINYGTDVRLRISLTNTGSSTTFSYRLEYAVYDGSCGSWTAIPNSATTEEFNMYTTAASHYNDQDTSTNVTSGPGVITDPSGYTFRSGLLVQSPSNTATNQTIEAGKFTELEYAIRPNTNASHTSYCFRVTTSAGTPMDAYNNYPILNINYPPTTPVVYSPLNAAANVPRLPIYQLRSADLNYDYLRYVVEVCPVNSFPCASGGHTYSEADSCWSAFDTQSGTAFSSRRTETHSTMAYCQAPNSDVLSPNTTYYMRAKAIDPGGTNSYSSYSSVVSFTTGTLDINITGGTCIGGVGSSCTSGSGGPSQIKIGG
jgi:hypothetical protein